MKTDAQGFSNDLEEAFDMSIKVESLEMANVVSLAVAKIEMEAEKGVTE